jgi:hypothetical protein
VPRSAAADARHLALHHYVRTLRCSHISCHALGVGSDLVDNGRMACI